MSGFGDLGKILVIMGLSLAALGAFLIFFHKIPFLGKLPGDIQVIRKNYTFYFPLASSILLSFLISLIFWLWSRR